MSAEVETTTCQVSGEIEVPQENNPDPQMTVEENKYPQNEDLSDKSPKHQTSTSFSTSPNQLPLLPLVEANIALAQKTSPNSSTIPPNTQDINKEGISSISGICPEDNTTMNADTAMKEEPNLPSSVNQQIILPISPILLQPSPLSVTTLLSNTQTSPTTSKSPLLQQPEQPRQTMQTPKQTQFQPSHGNIHNNKSSNSKLNNNNSNSQGSTSAWNEQSDFQKFTTAIASQPYLLFNTPDMAIPGLEASKDNLYHVYTFIVPNQPYQTIQQNIKHPNIQFPKKSGANSHNSLHNNQSFMQNNATTATPQNNNNNLLSQMNTPTTIKSSSPFFNPPTTPSRISPAGFQKPGDFSLPKSQSKQNITNAAFGSSSNFETPKIPHFGLGNTEKTERKISMNVAQSLVDLIKQQSRPKDSEHHEGEEERRKKSESVPTFNNLSGFKSNPSSMISSGQQSQQQSKLSQSSITNLLNLTLNPLAHFNHNNSSNLYADNSLSSQLHQQLGIIPEESQQTLELLSQNEDAQNQLAQQMIMKNEANYSNINNPNNDEECEEEDDDGDDDDKNNEEEEARLIREIKEMKWNNNNNGFKKDGSLQQFLSEGQDGDIFDFCEEKFLNGGKKGKKNLGGAGHKNKFDTKNLVKNFLNSFISFAHHPDEEAGIMDVLGFENPSQLNDFRTSLRNFFKGKKFNRVLLKEFIFEDIFRPLFLFFLENRALNWIEAGRMKDKASHLRALKNFIFVCQNHDQIKSWRFRYNFVQN